MMSKEKRCLWVYFLPRDRADIRDFSLKRVPGHSGHKVRCGHRSSYPGLTDATTINAH